MPDADKTLEIGVLINPAGAITGGAASEGAITKLKISTEGLSAETQKQLGIQQDLAKEMGVVNVSEHDVEAATRKTTDAVEAGSEKFSESRRETREAAGELGRLIGVQDLGTAAMGKTGAAVFAMGAALEYLKGTYEAIKETINGPIQIDIPPDAPAHISAAATAWNEYATARANVIATQQGPAGIESAEEKQLGRELQLIKEVLAAEKQKALADLELHKGDMSPEAYTASRDNISLIFDSADKDAERRNRQKLLADKDAEAANLENDAKAKTRQALAIKAAPKEVAESLDKTLETNAANAETSAKEIKERLALLDRVEKATKEGADAVPEYEGSYGKLQLFLEGLTAYKRYGTATFEEARAIEEPRLTQAEQAIHTADGYKTREDEASKTKAGLLETAGKESGQAENLRGEIKTDTTFDQQQDSADAYIASLHRQTAAAMMAGSAQTAQAVQDSTAAMVGGFRDVHSAYASQQEQINELRRAFQTIQAQSVYSAGNAMPGF